MPTTAVSCPSIPRKAALTRFFLFSVPSSGDPRGMDWPFIHLRPLHGLVAKFRVRNHELATGPPGVFRSSGTRNVLHRLVCIIQPAFFWSGHLALSTSTKSPSLSLLLK